MNKSIKHLWKLLAVIICISMVLVMSLSLISCKTEVAEETTAAETTAAETTAAETTAVETTAEVASLTYDPSVPVNDGKEITLNVWYSSSGWYEKWIEEYSKIHPNVKWNKVPTAGADWSKILLALQSGENIDILEPHNQFLVETIPNIEPFPQDILPVESFIKDFSLIEETMVDGKMYFYPGNNMTVGMVYNKTIWEEAGLTESDIPTTWDELVEISKQLTVTDDTGKITQCGFCINTFTPYIWIAMQYQLGRFLFAEDGKTANIDTVEGAQAAQYLYDMYYVNNIGDIGFPVGYETFGIGKSAISYAWGWMDGYLKYAYPELSFGWFKIPTFDGKVPPAYDRSNVQLVGAVAAKTSEKNKAVAFDFLKYIACNDQALIEFSVYSGAVPTKYSIMDDPVVLESEAIQIQLEQIDRAVWPGAIPDIYMTDLTKFLDESMMLDKVSVDEVLKGLQEQVNSDLAGIDFQSHESTYKYASELK